MIRITNNKFKRSLIILLTITTIMSLESIAPSFKTNKTAQFLEANKTLDPIIDGEEVYLVSNHIEELLPFEYIYDLEYDELEMLMEKFEVPFEYRDFTRQICMLYNIDPIIFVSLIQIESNWGRVENYNSFTKNRLYGNNYADIGLGQLSSRYFDYFKEYHFNKELLFSLGYVRNTFKATDPYINLQVSASYLSYLHIKWGDYKKTIMSYNAGETKVRKGIVPKMTLRYTNAILKQYTYIDEGDI